MICFNAYVYLIISLTSAFILIKVTSKSLFSWDVVFNCTNKLHYSFILQGKIENMVSSTDVWNFMMHFNILLATQWTFILGKFYWVLWGFKMQEGHFMSSTCILLAKMTATCPAKPHTSWSFMLEECMDGKVLHKVFKKKNKEFEFILSIGRCQSMRGRG